MKIRGGRKKNRTLKSFFSGFHLSLLIRWFLIEFFLSRTGTHTQSTSTRSTIQKCHRYNFFCCCWTLQGSDFHFFRVIYLLLFFFVVTSIRDKTIPNPRKSELNDESLNSIIRCFCLFVCLLFFFLVLVAISGSEVEPSTTRLSRFNENPARIWRN